MNQRLTPQSALSDDETRSVPGSDPRRGAGPLRPLPPDALILIPARNAVLFPGVLTPVTMGRPGSVAAAQAAVQLEQRVGFLLQRDAEQNDVRPNDLHWVCLLYTSPSPRD